MIASDKIKLRIQIFKKKICIIFKTQYNKEPKERDNCQNVDLIYTIIRWTLCNWLNFIDRHECR